jgi:uncharacterized protein YyaL (SSP411 family)
MSNQLMHESSPYLLQHAHNPVDWYPWGEEALQKAQAQDKPIFLSIGYSACHWCHVMAHESFEDERVAAIMNAHFVNVKVDREERPDLDRIYMNAVQAMTGSGGWPMSVFLTPDGRPFFGGTYFPPTRRHGLPSFTQVLLAVTEAWQNRRQEILESGQRILQAIEAQPLSEEPSSLSPATLESAFQNLSQRFDWKHGGWGAGPKFPQPMALEFLLRYHHTTGAPQALKMVTETLQAMACGGVYDQLGGGFHRYSVDNRWLVPHFEKMLYDNAQLAPVYLHAWQVTGDSFYRTIAEEILDYVVREMTDPAGGFYATQDADSEGQEGKFFVWEPAEIRDLLGQEAGAFVAAYGVTESGNFEGQNVLELVNTDQRAGLASARHKLLAAREKRVRPGRDEKVLTSWNGLMLAAFAEAARILERDDYGHVAERNADFLLRELQEPDGRLWHTWQAGKAKFNGYLEDYTHLIKGLLELYHTTFDSRWYLAARELAEKVLSHFGAPSGGFFDTSDDHETLITRPRELQDNAVPSGNAVAAWALLRLAKLAVEPRYAELARQSLGQVQPLMAQYPLGFGQWLVGLDDALSPGREVAIVGDDAQALLEVCAMGYRPHQVVALGAPGDGDSTVPLLRHRDQVAGRATAYVCVGSFCHPPLSDAQALRALLEG